MSTPSSSSAPRLAAARFRRADTAAVAEKAPAAACGCASGACASVGGAPSPSLAGAIQSKPCRSVLHIQQLCCPMEERLLRKQLAGMAGVGGLEFDLLSRKLAIAHDEGALPRILAAIEALGFEPRLPDDSTAVSPATRIWWRQGRLWLAGAAALLAELAHVWGEAAGGNQSVMTGLSLLLALLTLLLSGTQVFSKGWLALKQREMNIHVLMALAVSGAIALGQWPEAAMVLFLFAIAEQLEAASLERANRAIATLLELAPPQASRLLADGRSEVVAASLVRPGERIRIAPGARIPLDGTLLAGCSAVDESALSGESLPVEKQPGDRLFAGTLNQQGELICEVTAAVGDSTLAHIIAVVEQARQSKAPIARLIDRFARIYTPLVMLISLLVALLPPLLLAEPFSLWIYRALVILIIACPCALVIATPVTLSSALAAAARRGILIKGGAYLEQAARLTLLAFDKTGTLSQGKPQLAHCHLAEGGSPAKLHGLAASLASASDHPLARVIAAMPGVTLLPLQGVQQLPGKGMIGEYAGERYLLGSRRWLQQEGIGLEGFISATPGSEVLLARQRHGGGELLAQYLLSDQPKHNAAEVIAQLHRLGVASLILSGDNQQTTRAFADGLGIDEASGGLLPEQKLQALRAQQQAGRGVVGMVGDGINDAPALAQADLAIAMGVMGSDTAIETAAITLMRDDLQALPELVRLSRQTLRLMKQNIALALGIKGAFLLLTLLGLGSLWLAVFADMGTSLLVIGNGLRILKTK